MGGSSLDDLGTVSPYFLRLDPICVTNHYTCTSVDAEFFTAVVNITIKSTLTECLASMIVGN